MIWTSRQPGPRAEFPIAPGPTASPRRFRKDANIKSDFWNGITWRRRAVRSFFCDDRRLMGMRREKHSGK